MQKDFHYATVYVLCRLAGMKSKYAEKVAYSSQQVDDAVYDHALKFENGDIFHQTKTAHKETSVISSANVNKSFNIWLPFHFLPSGDEKNSLENFVTRPESPTINLLKKEVIDAGDKDYALHWLGIFLHLYADSYSHQQFKGFYDQYNFSELLDGVERLTLKDKIKKFLTKYIPILFPVGHALVIKNPDIPYANWKYENNGKEMEINNLEQRFMPAAKNIFKYVRNYLTENNKFGIAVKEETLDFKFNKIIDTLKYEDYLEGRYNNWLDKIHDNYFGFTDYDDIDANLSYDDRAWFKNAVKAERVNKMSIEGLKRRAYNYNKFTKKSDFATEDWTLFMKAAAEHKYRVLHEVLPATGLNVG